MSFRLLLHNMPHLFFWSWNLEYSLYVLNCSSIHYFFRASLSPCYVFTGTHKFPPHIVTTPVIINAIIDCFINTSISMGRVTNITKMLQNNNNILEMTPPRTKYGINVIVWRMLKYYVNSLLLWRWQLSSLFIIFTLCTLFTSILI